jgi:DNA-binding beta-propeller fold protein YncE
VSTIGFAARRVVDRIDVGRGAHHLAVSPDQRETWVALGETAHTIVVLDSLHPDHLRVVRRLHLETAAHDLAFSPNGRDVWVTSAAEPYVSVLNARSGRLVATVPAGPPPQHIVFTATTTPRALITSGYGSTIEAVDPVRRRVLRTASIPYGSFNLATIGNTVVTSSLLDGRVTELDAATLRRRMEATVAAAAREVAIVRG